MKTVAFEWIKDRNVVITVRGKTDKECVYLLLSAAKDVTDWTVAHEYMEGDDNGLLQATRP